MSYEIYEAKICGPIRSREVNRIISYDLGEYVGNQILWDTFLELMRACQSVKAQEVIAWAQTQQSINTIHFEGTEMYPFLPLEDCLVAVYNEDYNFYNAYASQILLYNTSQIYFTPYYDPICEEIPLTFTPPDPAEGWHQMFEFHVSDWVNIDHTSLDSWFGGLYSMPYAPTVYRNSFYSVQWNEYVDVPLLINDLYFDFYLRKRLQPVSNIAPILGSLALLGLGSLLLCSGYPPSKKVL